MEEGWFSDGETQAQRHKGAMAQGQSDWATKQLSEGAIERQEVRGFGSPFEGGQGDVGRAHSSETEVPLLEGTRRTTHDKKAGSQGLRFPSREGPALQAVAFFDLRSFSEAGSEGLGWVFKGPN